MATNEMLERRYVQDWLDTKHPKAIVYWRARVGPWPGGDRFAGVTRPFPDAILEEDGQVIIVEAKTRPDTRAIGQIQLYVDQFPSTPELRHIKDLPVRAVMLTTRDDPVLSHFAAKVGVDYEVYAPAWLMKIMGERAAEGR